MALKSRYNVVIKFLYKIAIPNFTNEIQKGLQSRFSWDKRPWSSTLIWHKHKHYFWLVKTREYYGTLREPGTVQFTTAFRARLSVVKPDRLVMHHRYRLYYCGARLPCLVWWIFPEKNQALFGTSKKAAAKRAEAEETEYTHANAILFPMAYYPIEKYSAPIFEADSTGKFTLVEDRGVVATGVVEHILTTAAPCVSPGSEGKLVVQ